MVDCSGGAGGLAASAESRSMLERQVSDVMGVTNPLNHPSHGGTYVVEGRLLLGSDWLVVIPEPCLPFTFPASPHIVPVRRTLYSHVSRASEWPYLSYHCYRCYHDMLCVRSHGVSYPMMDLPTYGLMTLSADAPRCSIMFHST